MITVTAQEPTSVFQKKPSSLCRQNIFSGPITNLFSRLCTLMKILSNANFNGEKQVLRISDFRLLNLLGLSDGAVSVAVKGLRSPSLIHINL